MKSGRVLRAYAIAYGKVAEVMAALAAAGFKKVALVNEPMTQK